MACPDVNQFLKEVRSDEKVPFGKTLQKLNAFSKSVTSAITSGEKADEFLNSIETKDFYGKKTKLELANALKRPGPVLEALKSDDQTILNRTLQFNWIYGDKDASPFLTDPEFLVRDFSPDISFSCRRKLINKLGKYCPFEDIADKIFQSVERSYGIELAKNLIPRCSKDTIANVFGRKSCHINSTQMTRIYKRYPETAQYYIKQNKQSYEYSGWNNAFGENLLRKICKDDPKTFMELIEKHYENMSSGFQLGRRLTKHFIKHEKSTAIKSSRIYSRILKPAEVKKRLTNEEFEEYFTNLFPQSVKEFQIVYEIGMIGYNDSGVLYTYLDRVPMSKRFEMLQKAFKKTYGQSILEFPEYITSRIIQTIPPEERTKWIDLKLRSPDGQYLYQSTGDVPLHREGYWEAFRPISQSIEKIKGYLSKEGDVQRRGDLLSSCVRSCLINDDKATLAQLCEYVISRFRNDSVQVRMDFLESIDSCFNMEKLDASHWTHINELLQISSINNEFSHRSHPMKILLGKSIQYGLKNNISIQNQVQHYIKVKTREYCHGEEWRFFPNESALDKKCLRIFAEQIGLMFPPSIQCSSDSTITTAIISLSESISGWNKSNKKDEGISSTEFPWLMTRLQEILDSYHEPNKDRVISALGNDKVARAILFPKLLKSYPLYPVALYFLTNEPERLNEHAESIVGVLTRSNKIGKWTGILFKLRSQGFPSLLEKMVNKCLEIAEDEDESVKERCNAVVIMSILLDTHHFLDWIAKFNPKDGKLDTYSEEAGVTYEFRKAISKCLKNISVPSKGLSTLAHYCVGDYLKLIVGCLYSLTKRSAGSVALPFLKELVNRPVSVKKHAIRLVLSFSCKCENIDFLRELWNSEKNYSIRHIIFRSIFEFFLSNNTEESWNLLETSIKTLTADDHPFLNELGRHEYIKSDVMPIERLSQYLRLAWDTVESLGDYCLNSNWIIVSLLHYITPDSIKHISESFLEEIFDKNLFVLKEDACIESCYVQVAINYVLYSESPQKVTVIAKCLQRLTGSSWNTPKKNSPVMFPAKQGLTQFVEQLSMDSFLISGESKIHPTHLIEIFSKLLESLESSLDPCDFFADHLFLSFSKIFHSTKVDRTTEGEALKDIGKQVGLLVDKLVGLYKGEIIGVISESLQRFVSMCFKNKLMADKGDGARVIWIIDGILNCSGSLDTQIVASHLLLTSNSNPYKGHTLEGKFLEALTALKSSDNKTVKLYVNYRFSQCRSICASGYDVLV